MFENCRSRLLPDFNTLGAAIIWLLNVSEALVQCQPGVSWEEVGVESVPSKGTPVYQPLSVPFSFSFQVASG